jgi:hypothetical protein
MVAIAPCVVEAVDSLGNQYYRRLGASEVVDMTCIRGVVGRVKVDKLWSVIDRTGRAHPVLDEFD